MAYLNKDEATKAFEIAKENLGSGKYEEALISASEARQMNPELPDIKKLVTLSQVMSAGPCITHYGILGVEETANENKIRLAYCKLAVDLNPNTNHFPKASEAFRRISEAMGVLSYDRLKYDNDLAAAREDCAIVAEMEALARAVPGFKAVFGKDVVDAPERGALFDVVVAPESGAPFGIVEAFNVFKTIHGNGMISSSELQAAFKAFDEEAFNVFEAVDGNGMISSSELRAAFEAYDEEPQSTTHQPSQKGFVCSYGEVAGRGTKRSNTTQATLTHPVPKKKLDGQSPLLFK